MRKNILRAVCFSLLVIIIPSYAQVVLGGMHFYDIPNGHSETVILYNLSSKNQYSLTCGSIAISSIDNMQIRLKSENSDLTGKFGNSKKFISPSSLIPLSVPYNGYSQAIIYTLTNLSAITQHGHCNLESFVE